VGAVGGIREPRIAPPPAGTVALTACRDLPDGRTRQYTATTFPSDPWRGCERFVRMCGAISHARNCEAGSRAYALLDAINEEGDILETWDIPTAQAFRFIYRKLHLRVERTDEMAAAQGGTS
jgi:hypothetical protein